MIWLVRHGESVANAGLATFDYSAVDLTDRGRVQAETIAATCAEMPSWIGVSPYRRAKLTAAPLIDKYPSVPVIELAVQEFTYLAKEKCEGMDSFGRQPLVDQYWMRGDPNYCDGDGAESFSTFWLRLEAFLVEAARRGGFGIVYTHEQFIRGILLAAIYPGVAPTAKLMLQFFALRTAMPVPNGAIVQIRMEADQWWTGGVKVSHLGDGRVEIYLPRGDFGLMMMSYLLRVFDLCSRSLIGFMSRRETRTPLRYSFSIR